MLSLIKKAVLAGLGAVAGGRETFDDLVRRGEQSQTDFAKTVKGFMTDTEKTLKKLEEKERECVDQVLKKMPMATKSDLDRLEKKIEELAARVGRGGKA
jgi:polyhydroxyalkanoate synthesis regulator phasin